MPEGIDISSQIQKFQMLSPSISFILAENTTGPGAKINNAASHLHTNGIMNITNQDIG